MSRLPLLLLCLWVFSAHADLYRWVDPETGSVKFSSYPPPWFGDEQQKRAPVVEHIPPRKAGDGARVEPARDAARDAGPGLEALERQRRETLQQIATSAGRPGASGEVQKQLESLAAVMQQLDKLNPEGAAARRTEAEALLQKLINREKK